MKNIIVRIDDFPRALKIDERINDANRRDRLFIFDKLFKMSNVDYYLGVVPSLINENDVALFKKLNIKIAMHGFDHQPGLMNKQKDDILKDLNAGINIFKQYDINTDVYISPFNEISDTLKDALCNDLGFKIFFGGEINDETQIADYKGANNTMKCYQSPKKYYNVAEKIVIDKNDENILITLHYTWEISFLFGYLSCGLNKLLKQINELKQI